jgi:beta-galactosidase
MVSNQISRYIRFFCCVPFIVLCLGSGGCITEGRQGVDAVAEPRQMIPLVEWEFCEDKTAEGIALTLPDQAEWVHLTIPHIFRQSGLPDESAGWYRRTFTAADDDKGKRFYLLLEGAATVKDVFVNGRHIGKHRGAYTAAAFDLTAAVKFGQSNTLLMRVSNRDAESANCLSRSTLYYVNGGLYRKAWLVKTGAVHIYPDLGSCGVYITPANITTDKADLNVRTVVFNPLDRPVDVIVRHIVAAPDGAECARFETRKTFEPNEKTALFAVGIIRQPKLWGIAKPNLYTVRTELLADGRLSDVVAERTGFRTIAIKDNKFYLNGNEFRVRGVNKHHQNEHNWNALSDEELRSEWDWMTDMGGNTVRLAHYPHSRLEYSIADERGIAVWAENGLAGQLWNDPGNEEKTVTPDGERITREMVRQNWNHPSILFWSCGNETISEVASYYASVIREEDSSRLVAYAAAPNTHIPEHCDFVAFNTYDGWYGGHYTDFKRLPMNAFVSETGAGDWITHHIPYGAIQWKVDQFEPEEYAGMFAEYRLQTVCIDDAERRPMFLWWNFREFYNLKFKKNRNTKGIVTLAGMPKDVYYLFQAFFRPEYPVLCICGRHHFLRQTAADNGIKAYSNASELELILNGVSQGTLKNRDYRLPDSQKRQQGGTIETIPGIRVDNVFFWKAPLRPGRNVVEVRDGRGTSKEMVIYQKSADGSVPADANAIVADLKSSNPNNPAVFIDRPVGSQGPFYYDVDGSSDNTFDTLPPQIEGAAWIATRRLSDPNMKTDLSFRLNADSIVYVLYSAGTFPNITLRKPNEKIQRAAAALTRALSAAGFQDTGIKTTWRGHDLVLAHCALWSRPSRAGETLTIPGHTLDYVILIKPKVPFGSR